MRVFHCDHCSQLVFFENTHCVKCQTRLAYVPSLGVVASLDPIVGSEEFVSPLPRATGLRYRLCSNYTVNNVCNWAVDSESPHTLCESCRLTRTIPDLSVPPNRPLWSKIETAKRRLVYTHLGLRLPVSNKTDDPENGLAFDFLADAIPGNPSVLTGHADGVITLNIAEADDAEREKRRVVLGEPYRTLLGHFRHEVGHYYWNRLIEKSQRLVEFRKLFGDERADYGEALKQHYQNGPSFNWQDRFVSAYAGAHPWEDWAESWAHYLHITDTLEVAAACGLTLRPTRRGEPRLQQAADVLAEPDSDFDDVIDSWFALTYVLNNLNRSMGQPDGYPFVLSPAVIGKLEFVHETIKAWPASAAIPAATPPSPARGG